MNQLRISLSIFLGLLAVFSPANISGQREDATISYSPSHLESVSISNIFPAYLPSDSAKIRFSNPTVERFRYGCTPENLNKSRFAGETPVKLQISFCRAFQKVSDNLNNTNWSPKLREELQQIWQVFTDKNVRIRPMRKGVSKKIALAAEPFTHSDRGFGFNASIYIRPKFAKKKVFFLLAMHELRHIYDFHRLWETGSALPEAELEKRGFRIMGRIARETNEKEKFKGLPKVWKDSWAMYSQTKIASKMEATIEKFMGKSRFYRDRLRQPNRFMIGFVNRSPVPEQSQQATLIKPRKDISAGSGLGSPAPDPEQHDRPISNDQNRPASFTNVDSDKSIAFKSAQPPTNTSDVPPRLVRAKDLKRSKSKVAPIIKVAPFDLVKAKDKKNSKDLLQAALSNEKLLYYNMGDYSYDEDFALKCLRKSKIYDGYQRTRSVNRTNDGQPLFQDEKASRLSSRKKSGIPKCLLNLESINTDTTETFWAAAYLDEMPIKFDYFTKMNGVNVARYTVYKPTPEKFKSVAAKYPFIKPFRVFFGTIFVSVEDSQIIKFWGSSFPEAQTTGHISNKIYASYNSTAIREKLETGIWVTTSLRTVAVVNKKGKMRPFSYLVKYKNYRKITRK